MVYRHAFPGPGLGVRILGEVKKEYADTLRLADHIFIQELHAAGLYHKTSLAFAVFLPSNPSVSSATPAATNTSSPCAPWRPSTS